MRRGFKAEAERLAVRLRADLDIASDERIDIDKLARSIGVDVVSADSLVPLEDLEKLEELQPNCFSAATFNLSNGRIVAITNPVGTSPARRDSDLAHELAHVILKHETRSVDRIGDLTFFECDNEQEDEANWLGGCLLLPRPLLLIEARRGKKIEEIAEQHRVSIEMARFRYNTSGVQFQVAGRRRSSAG